MNTHGIKPAHPAASPASTPTARPSGPPLAFDGLPAAPPAMTLVPLNRLSLAAPFQWLALGWRDFRCAPYIGLFYGICFIAMGWAMLGVYEYAPAYTLALSAGFLLMGPFIALGLYHASRRLERGEMPDLGASLFAWQPCLGTMAIFGTVLLVLEMIWARVALIIFAVSFDTLPDLGGSLLTLLTPEHLGFLVTYFAVGGLFAALIFGISVVSIPMILDRQTDAITAGLTSLRLCFAQPGVMLLWGALITLLTVLALLPGFVGLLAVGPVLGHASWHAYRAAVGDSAEETGREPGR